MSVFEVSLLQIIDRATVSTVRVYGNSFADIWRLPVRLWVV